jgi:hypothetical protein
MASKKKVKVDKIELLTGSANLVTWKDDFKGLAQMKGLWGHFDPITIARYANLPRPHDDRFRIQPTEPTRRTRTTEQEPPIEYDHYAYTAEYKANQDFQSEEEEAKGLIRMAVEPTLRSNANDHHTAKSFYDWLIKQYSPKQDIEVKVLFNEYSKLPLASCINMQEYIDQHKRIIQRIIGASGTIDEAQRQARLEEGLTHDYLPFINMLNTCIPNENKNTFDKMSKLLIDQKYQLGQQEKQVNAVVTTPHKPRHAIKHANKKDQLKRCPICRMLHRSPCLVKKEEIPSHWSIEAQERMRKRIQEYNQKRKDAKPIATTIETNKSYKKRKGNDQEPICTLITLPPPRLTEPIETAIEANHSFERRKGNRALMTNEPIPRPPPLV